MKTKISFDFDGTLTKPSVQEYVKSLVKSGDFEIFIITARFNDDNAPKPDWNKDLYSIADEIGIKRDNIVFMKFENKSEFLKHKDFLFHVDDDFIELGMIDFERSKGTLNTASINCFGNTEWIDKCNELINKL